uniref:Disease resistance N-terminal domain-containing protein n=1 Tax=Aegilops tauschii TaxID=37682 RepID=M8AWL7_AEGTA
MADALIGPLVGRLQELALSQARALVAVNKDIRRLRDKLMFLQAFLREADAKRHLFSDEITRVWLQETRDAVFDAEDAVDHYYLQVDMSRQVLGLSSAGGSKSWRRRPHSLGLSSSMTVGSSAKKEIVISSNDVEDQPQQQLLVLS